MIVDSSALVAVVFQEPGYEHLVDQLVGSDATGIGTPTMVETGIVLAARLRKDARSLLTRMLDELDITEVPFGEPHWREALAAYRRFGRGRQPSLRIGMNDAGSSQPPLTWAPWAKKSGAARPEPLVAGGRRRL